MMEVDWVLPNVEIAVTYDICFRQGWEVHTDQNIMI